MADEKVWTSEQREAAREKIWAAYSKTSLIHNFYEHLAVDLQCELTAKDTQLAEAVELLRKAVDSEESLGFVVDCNTQDPDMHEKECPEGYVNECGRCEYVHAIQRFLKRNTGGHDGN